MSTRKLPLVIKLVILLVIINVISTVLSINDYLYFQTPEDVIAKHIGLDKREVVFVMRKTTSQLAYIR